VSCAIVAFTAAAISRALFQKQEFVDAAVVEATIAQLTSRDETRAAARAASWHHRR